MFAIVGLLFSMICVFGVFIAHGGNIGVVLKALPFEMATIMGAALGAFLVANPMKVVKQSLKGIGQCFKGSRFTKARYMELLALMFDILQKARKEGLMAIEQDVIFYRYKMFVIFSVYAQYRSCGFLILRPFPHRLR